MTKSNSQINKEADLDDRDTSPAVIAYRMAQVERTVKEGFKQQTDQLGKLVDGFVSAKEMAEVRKEAADEHLRLWTALNDIKKNAKWWLSTIFTIIGTVAALLVATRH